MRHHKLYTHTLYQSHAIMSIMSHAQAHFHSYHKAPEPEQPIDCLLGAIFMGTWTH